MCVDNRTLTMMQMKQNVRARRNNPVRLFSNFRRYYLLHTGIPFPRPNCGWEKGNIKKTNKKQIKKKEKRNRQCLFYFIFQSIDACTIVLLLSGKS